MAKNYSSQSSSSSQLRSPSPESVDSSYSYSGDDLIKAIKDRDFDLVEKIIDQGTVDLNYVGIDNEDLVTPLLLAIYYDEQEIFGLLAEAGVNLNFHVGERDPITILKSWGLDIDVIESNITLGLFKVLMVGVEQISKIMNNSPADKIVSSADKIVSKMKDFISDNRNYDYLYAIFNSTIATKDFPAEENNTVAQIAAQKKMNDLLELLDDWNLIDYEYRNESDYQIKSYGRSCDFKKDSSSRPVVYPSPQLMKAFKGLNIDQEGKEHKTK